MICKECKIGADLKWSKMDPLLAIQAKKFHHDKCKGSTWCDCQHRLKSNNV